MSKIKNTQVPTEARDIDFPGTRITRCCEPPDMGSQGIELRSPARVMHTLIC